MGMVSVAEAADRLGMSTRNVQYLAEKGDLVQVARGFVDELSIERLLAVRGNSHVRAWSESTAWGAISLLSGEQAEWMGNRQRSRLRARLREISAENLVERARGRAVVTRYRAHSSARRYLLTELVRSDNVAGHLGLAETNRVDGYLSTESLYDVISRHGIFSDVRGDVTLRATSMDMSLVRDLAGRGVVLAAIDLAESLDVRERRAGLDGLDRALEAFRD